MNKLYLALSFIMLTSCSNIGYMLVQSYEKAECQKQPQPLINECLERASKSYDDYKKEREKFLNNSE